MNESNRHVRRRGYLATAYDLNGEEVTFYFKSGGALDAWRMAAVEASSMNLSLRWVKHLPYAEYIIHTDGV